MNPLFTQARTPEHEARESAYNSARKAFEEQYAFLSMLELRRKLKTAAKTVNNIQRGKQGDGSSAITARAQHDALSALLLRSAQSGEKIISAARPNRNFGQNLFLLGALFRKNRSGK